MKFLYQLVLLSCIFYSSNAYGQVKVARQLVEEAEILTHKEDFNGARQKLEQAVNAKNNFIIAHRLLGAVNMKLRRYEDAVVSYEALFKLQPDFSRAAYFECAEAYMKLLRYDDALKYFTLYKFSDNRDYKTDEQTLQLKYEYLTDRMIRSCKYASKLDLLEVIEEPLNLGGGINSSNDEYLPSLTGDGSLLVYTSHRGDENIFVCKRKKNGSWTDSRSIGRAINTDFNEGMAKLTVCSRTLYFAACNWENGMGGCDIFEAEFDMEDGMVSNVQPSTGLNTNVWDSQPVISCDGTTIYFASNRPGGFGGTDIWMSKLGKNNVWGEPVNLGEVVNSEGDEEAPYIAPDGVTLYFSSDGHPGLGEADIFRTVWAEDHWLIPQNLGRSINSPFREAGIVVSPDGKTAYFASAREGGKGGLDIYETKLYRAIAPKEDNVMLDGLVFNAETGEPIEGATVKLGKSGEPKRVLKTDKEGRFFACLPNKATYSYIVDKEGYHTSIEAQNFSRQEGVPSHKVEVALASKTLSKALDPKADPVGPKAKLKKNLSVYFESGKHELTDAQKEQILKLVNQFEDKSTVKIKVTGFADDIGNKEFNLNLSQKRAAHVADFISGAGVPSGQITSSGEGVVETNVAKHQKRRVEIIIIN